jgi:hypothetical protein
MYLILNFYTIIFSILLSKKYILKWLSLEWLCWLEERKLMLMGCSMDGAGALVDERERESWHDMDESEIQSNDHKNQPDDHKNQSNS